MNPLIDQLMAGMDSMPAQELERLRRALERGMASAGRSRGRERHPLRSPQEQQLADAQELLQARQAEIEAVLRCRSSLRAELQVCRERQVSLQQREQRLQVQIGALDVKHAECLQQSAHLEARVAQLEAGQ